MDTDGLTVTNPEAFAEYLRRKALTPAEASRRAWLSPGYVAKLIRSGSGYRVSRQAKQALIDALGFDVTTGKEVGDKE